MGARILQAAICFPSFCRLVLLEHPGFLAGKLLGALRSASTFSALVVLSRVYFSSTSSLALACSRPLRSA